MEDRIKRAKEIPIEEYLFSRGYKPKRGSSGKHLFYLSMLRDENKPSFVVNRHTNKWKDLGLCDKWEDIISLVQIIDGVNFIGALEILLKIKIDTNTRNHVIQENKPGVEIVQTLPIQSKVLIDYLQGRGVDIDLARIYCVQAIVRFPGGRDPEQKHAYIGFRNDKGGYELRNHYRSSIRKISTSPKYFSRIAGNPDKYNLFEGFIDYLTLLTKYRTQSFKNTTVVLNSLVNLTYLYETMKSNDENNLFLDNDEPADKYIFKGDKKLKIESLKERGIPYTDRREMFKFANDINDYATGKIYI